MTRKYFLKRVKNIHGKIYDYNLENEFKSTDVINIKCKNHGFFKQTVTNHLQGKGCNNCAISKSRLTQREFINKAVKIHKNKYDYRNTVYTTTRNSVTIICKLHGEFSQRAAAHLLGQGCKECANIKLRNNKKVFIKKAKKVHNNKYDYSLVKYRNNKTKIKIICEHHGIFKQRPNCHLNGKGCKKCAIKYTSNLKRGSKKEFIEKSRLVHDDLYEYSKIKYVDRHTDVLIKCNKHGYFKQKPHIHLNGSGCKKCSRSSGERKVANFLRKNNIEFIEQKRFPSCKYKKSLPFDFYLPNEKILIEYQGRQHFEAFDYYGGKNGLKYRQKLDKIKKDWCENNQFKLIIIRHDEKVKQVLKLTLFK